MLINHTSVGFLGKSSKKLADCIRLAANAINVNRVILQLQPRLAITANLILMRHNDWLDFVLSFWLLPTRFVAIFSRLMTFCTDFK